jgi:uncharacterized surface protein with fasciclin (FAS1) repeats
LIDKRTWLGLSASLLIAACATAPAPKTITDLAAATPELSTFRNLLADGGLADSLRGTGPFTVFAPSDNAFKAVPAKTMAELASDKALLQSLLGYHVMAGQILAEDVKNGPAKTLQGSSVALARAGTFVTVEEAVVTRPDMRASNGVIHIVDRVLIPPRK